MKKAQENGIYEICLQLTYPSILNHTYQYLFKKFCRISKLNQNLFSLLKQKVEKRIKHDYLVILPFKILDTKAKLKKKIIYN